jgi:acetyl-CoA carboxylase biotin carboxylase subunit
MAMFRKVLIANRGEIALRVVQACRELGVQTVAVYSTADRESLHVVYADEEVCIGPPPSTESYLNVSSLIAAAEITGADAIHPGYGFLSENAHFAEVLRDCNLAWIGPPPEVIRMMGDKAQARETARRAGVPVLPGSREPLVDAAEALLLAEEVGYPVILKAAAGGGGRGMRIVERAEELEGQLGTASEEAAKAFGDGSVYLEKYLTAPRHIETQVFGDKHGNVVHFGERECSIQRRHQKLIEEAPSPALTPELRERMGEAALRLCREVGYENAGTIEFLLDEDGRFYFMEMNTRIQVEHPVTEMVTGVDLVKLQLKVAAGEKLGIPSGLKARGHAIECRVNAEDPETFRPSPGRLTTFHLPGGPGVRVDTHGYEDYVIPPHYDSLVAKVITHGRDREEASVRMLRALDFFVVEGIRTSIPLHRQILQDPEFRAGRLTTRFLPAFLERRRAVAQEVG